MTAIEKLVKNESTLTFKDKHKKEALEHYLEQLPDKVDPYNEVDNQLSSYDTTTKT